MSDSDFLDNFIGILLKKLAETAPYAVISGLPDGKITDISFSYRGDSPVHAFLAILDRVHDFSVAKFGDFEKIPDDSEVLATGKTVGEHSLVRVTIDGELAAVATGFDEKTYRACEAIVEILNEDEFPRNEADARALLEKKIPPSDVDDALKYLATYSLKTALGDSGIIILLDGEKVYSGKDAREAVAQFLNIAKKLASDNGVAAGAIVFTQMSSTSVATTRFGEDPESNIMTMLGVAPEVFTSIIGENGGVFSTTDAASPQTVH